MTKNIFLPFYHNGNAIHLITLETFGRPIRYFNDPEDPLLRPYWKVAAKSGAKIEDGIKIDERASFDIEYNFARINDDWYIKTDEALAVHTLSSLDDLFEANMPAELLLAVLRIATGFLKETEMEA